MYEQGLFLKKKTTKSTTEGNANPNETHTSLLIMKNNFKIIGNYFTINKQIRYCTPRNQQRHTHRCFWTLLITGKST